MAKDRFALIIATSRYRDPELHKLTSPRRDAEALAKVLRDPEIGDFDVTTLHNKNACAVTEKIEEFLTGRTAEQTILVYFSGHGVKDDSGRLYLTAPNTTRSLLRSTAVAATFLSDVMRTCRARTQVLILDCCFGGAFAKHLIGAKSAGGSVGVNEAFEGAGRVILSSSNAIEFSFEEEGVSGEARLSVYTRTIVDGLRTGAADIDHDDRISVQDLYDFAYQRMTMPGSRQTPTITSIGQEGKIYVASVAKKAVARAKAQPLTPPGSASADRPDLRPWVRILDSGPEMSNPALAAVTAMETFLGYRGIDVRLSPRYVYQKGKQLDDGKQSDDGGLSMEVVVKVIEEHGVPLEEDWPYVPGQWQLPKGKTWKMLDIRAQAYQARLIRVTAADDIPFHLGKGRPVLSTFDIYESTWMGAVAARRGIITVPLATEKPIGSIATTIVDFEARAQVFRFAHTWGEHWGDHGFGEMSIEAVQVMFNREEMWAVEVRTGDGLGWKPKFFTPTAAAATSARAGTVAALGGESTVAASVPDRREHAARKPKRIAHEPGTPERAIYNARMQNWAIDKQPPETALVRIEGQPPTGDPAVDETYDALGIFHQFFRDVFGRDSWDGTGGRLEAVVHFGRDFENTFWVERRVYIGDGGNFLKKLYQLDIVAKELSMGLVQSQTKLRYENQSGALMQSIGLVFGSMVKQFHLGQTAAKATWMFGEGVLLGGKALASLEHPGTAYDDSHLGKDPQVDHLSKYRKMTEDSGGVHVNCGIPNRAFVLLAKSLKGRSWERAGRVWYETLRGLDQTTTLTFRQFAKRTVTTAAKLFADETEVAKHVRDAWARVGIKL